MKFKVLVFTLLISLGVHAQEIAPGAYWIYFSDKDGDSYQKLCK